MLFFICFHLPPIGLLFQACIGFVICAQNNQAFFDKETAKPCAFPIFPNIAFIFVFEKVKYRQPLFQLYRGLFVVPKGVITLQKMKILIIEDAETVRNELKEFLSAYGYEVEAPDDFQNILSYAIKQDIHLILLDINLPVFDGYFICREIRKTSQVPIIVVTSRDNEMDELMSMNLGADDFVTKPYNTQILLARMDAVLKRTYKQPEALTLTLGELKLHLSSGTISYKDEQQDLTKNELKILHYLMTKKGSIVSREELMEHLWSSDLFVDDNTLSVNMTRLRRKIESLGMENPIETRRGLGYILS